MTAETLAGAASVILSLAFAYVPHVREWYAARETTEKAGIMAVLLIVIAVLVFVLSCGAIISVGITCDQSGAVGLVQILIAALVANQSSFVLLVKPFQGTSERI